MRNRAPQQIVNALLRTQDEAAREPLLEEAARQPETFALLQNRAQSSLMTAPQEALTAARIAVLVARRRTEWPNAAGAHRVEAQALRVLGRHEEALSAFDAAADCARQVGDEALAAQVQIGRIDSLGMLGQYDEAIRIARQIEAALRNAGLVGEAAKALVNLGSIYYRRDRYSEALNCYEQAHVDLAASGDPLAVARVDTNRANILALLNRADEAIALFETSRAAFEAAGIGPIAAMIDANIGFLHYISGKHAVALASLTRSREGLTAHGQELELAKCDADMADVYRALNLTPEALECYERAIAIFESLGLGYERGRSELGRAALLLSQQRNAEATAALDRAESLFRTQKNAFQQAQTLLIRAYVLRAEARLPEALRAALRSERILRRLRLPGWAAEAQFVAAATELEQDRNAVRRMHSVLRVAQQHARGWLECRAHRTLGLYYLRRNDPRRGLNHLRAGVNVLETTRTLIATEDLHLAFLRDKLAVYEDLVVALLERSRRQDIAEALEVVERSKSRLLLERAQTLAANRPRAAQTPVGEMQARLATLRAELSREYYRLNAVDADDTRRLLQTGTDGLTHLAQLEKTYSTLLREQELSQLASHTHEFALGTVVSAPKLRTALAVDEMLVEYVNVQGEVGAFLLGRDGLRVRFMGVCQEEVAHTLRRLRYHLQKIAALPGYAAQHRGQLIASVNAALHRLYEMLLLPLEAHLTTEKLTLVPHGFLHGVPFHALYDGENYVLDRWEVVYAPSAAFWFAGKQRAPRHRRQSENLGPALLIGVPDTGIARVTQEVKHVQTLVPEAKLLLAEQATTTAFYEHAPDCRLLHLATHALFREDNPLFSGIRFADDWLLARDLYSVGLDCDLATLSACRTGVSYVDTGDELFGLLRGFLAAGARTVAASLWPADDEATTALMHQFYTHLAAGHSRAAALRQAQQSLRESYPHPYHWAAFMLVGER